MTGDEDLAGSACLLLKRLAAHAASHPDEVAFVELDQGEHERRTITWSQLEQRVAGISSHLQSRLDPGDRALLLYPPGIEYLAGFLGCLSAGVIAVPAYPPDPMRLDRTLPRLERIVADAGARLALVDGLIDGLFDLLDPAAPIASIPRVATDSLPDLSAASHRPAGDAHGVAFLQYTSGSTGSPKGVMVTHDNISANISCIFERAALQSGHTIVTWLPPYHDMGLIGTLLATVYGRLRCIMMSPLDFLSRPMRWLEVISHYGAHGSTAPDFAYALCARKATDAEVAELDLSQWRVAINGAEPLRSSTIEMFSQRFAAAGFRHSAFMPAFGLAEATLMVSASAFDEGARLVDVSITGLEQEACVRAAVPGEESRTIISCGSVVTGHEIAIVDGDVGTEAEPGGLGEIWMRGPSVACGYWNDHDATAATFDLVVPGRAGAGWMRTGDLGALVEDELIVTGRIKDLIIVAGRNYAPSDIERTVEASHELLRPGSSVAVNMPDEDDGSSGIAVIAEVDDRSTIDPGDLVEYVRSAVALEHDLRVAVVALIPARTLPKTSSGKVQRSAAAAALSDGSLHALVLDRIERPPWRPAQTQMQQVLIDSWQAALGIEDIGIDDDFLSIGGNSLLASRVVTEVRARTGLAVELRDLAGAGTIVEIAAVLEQFDERSGAAGGEARRIDLGLVDRCRLEVAARDVISAGSTGRAVCAAIRIMREHDVEVLRSSVAQLVAARPFLRCVAGGDPHPGRLVYASLPGATDALEVLDTSTMLPELADRAVATTLHELANLQLDVADMPPWRASAIREEDGSTVLALAMHPALADLCSLDVALADWAAVLGGDAAVVCPDDTSRAYSSWNGREESEVVLLPELAEPVAPAWIQGIGFDLSALVGLLDELEIEDPTAALGAAIAQVLEVDEVAVATRVPEDVAPTLGPTRASSFRMVSRSATEGWDALYERIRSTRVFAPSGSAVQVHAGRSVLVLHERDLGCFDDGVVTLHMRISAAAHQHLVVSVRGGRLVDAVVQLPDATVSGERSPFVAALEQLRQVRAARVT